MFLYSHENCSSAHYCRSLSGCTETVGIQIALQPLCTYSKTMKCSCTLTEKFVKCFAGCAFTFRSTYLVPYRLARTVRVYNCILNSFLELGNPLYSTTNRNKLTTHVAKIIPKLTNVSFLSLSWQIMWEIIQNLEGDEKTVGRNHVLRIYT
jgi:hypothetical protein